MSFFDDRRKALGLTGGSSPDSLKSSASPQSSFFQQRKMELGLTPDTRPKGPDLGNAAMDESRLVNQSRESVSSPQSSNVQQNPINQPANGDMRTDYPGGLINPLNALGHLANSPILRTFDYAAGKAMGIPDNMMNSAKSTGNDFADKAIGFAGGTAGLLTNPSMPVGNLGVVKNFFEHPQVTQLAQGAGNKLQGLLPDAGMTLSKDGSQIVDSLLGKTINSTAKNAVQGGLGAAAYAPFQTLSSGQDVQDIPRNILEQGLTGAAFGGALGAVSPTLGAGLSKLLSKPGELPKTNAFDEAARNRLTTPAAKTDLNNGDVFADNFKNNENFNSPDQQFNRAQSELDFYKQSMEQKYNANNENINIADRLNSNEKNTINNLQQKVDAFSPKTENIAIKSADASNPLVSDVKPTNERGVFDSLKQSDLVNPQTIDTIKQQGETTYTQKTNVETLDNANKLLHEKGVDGTKSHVLEKTGSLNDEETAAAFKLLNHYQNHGDFESAAKLGHKLMTSGTENGRAVQINSIFNRMTPEGAVKFAAKVIQDATKGEKSLTPEQTMRITEAAQRLQKAVTNRELSSGAITTISKLKNGEKISAEESAQLKQFAKLAEKTVPKDEVKQYRDLTGKEKIQNTPVTELKPRTRDIVTSFTSRQAEAARARIQARRGQLNSLPLDEWADYAIIGADHITQGAKSFADFSEKMMDELGRASYSQMNRIYVESMQRFNRQNKIPMSNVEKLVNKAISTHGIDANEAYAIKAKAIELAQMTGREKELAESMLHSEFQQLTDPTFGKQLASLLRSAQLLNPRTSIRNVISNMMFYALDTNIRRLSSVVDLTTSWNNNREIFWRNAPDIWKSFFSDVAYGAKAGWEGRNPGGFNTQYDLGNLAFDRNGNWFNQMGSFFERSLGAVNKSMDYASANMAMKNELFQISQTKAYAEGLRGAKMRDKAIDYFHTADEKMLGQAKEYGDYMTFQDKNFASDSAQKIKSALNLGKDFGLGNFLLNYPKTPANILMRAVDYSPLGYMKFVGNFVKMASQQNVNKKTLIQDFMRASGGSAMLWMAYEISKAGLINVLPSKNTNINSLERSAGIVSNSVNVDGLIRYARTMFSDPSVAKPKIGDSYASMDWAQPMAISASAGAAFAQAQDPSRLQKGVNAGSAAIQSLTGAMESAGNMSVLQNIKQAIMGNSNNPNQTIMDRVGQIVSSIPASFVPSVLNQIRNTIDPKTRDTKQGGLLEQTIAQLENKIPGLSQNPIGVKLPVRIDTLGNEMQSQFGTGTRAVNAFANPSLMGKYDPNQAAQVILDLINKTGDQNLAPTKPQKSLKLMGQNVKLSPDEYQNAQISKGQNIQTFINQNMGLFKDPKLSDDAKANVLKSLLSASSSMTNANTKLQKIK